MDKRQQRTQAKMERIQDAALELFAAYGADKVSMDEIADKANVSKVTIYKYFGSKEELYAAVIDLYVERTLAAAEAVINSDRDFLDKLQFGMLSQVNASPLVSSPTLAQVWDENRPLGRDMRVNLQDKVKALMRRLFEEGKQQGYIDENLSFEVAYLYSTVIAAGLQARAGEVEAVLVDKQAVESLTNLYFFGLVKR